MPLFEGTSGNDSIVGSSGNDTLIGYGGDDTLVGGGGQNTLIGGAGNDSYVLSSPLDAVAEEAGNDTAYLLLNGSSLIIVLSGTGIENAVALGSGNYYLYGENGPNNMLVGGAGNDTLDGASGSDTVIGGAGNDVYIVDDLTDVVIETIAGGGGTDVVYAHILYGGAFTLGANLENLILTGNNAPVDGIGNALGNVLIGDGRSNLLDGKGGIDTLSGGGGSDTYILDSFTELQLVSGVEDPFDVNGYDHLVLEFDTASPYLINLVGAAYEGFAAITFSGTGEFSAEGNSQANRLVGNASNNRLTGGAGNPWSSTDDTLIGGGGDDTLLAGDGVDWLEGGAGADILDGGLDEVGISYGNWLDAGDGDDTLTGGFRNDTLLGGAGNDNLAGGDGQDSLDGGDGNDIIAGGAGNDYIDGGSGSDTMSGAGGDDLYILSESGELLSVFENADEGQDTLRLNFSAVIVSVDLTSQQFANFENVVVTGNAVVDLIGNAANNQLTAGAGNNFIAGGGGNDILDGGSGNDTVSGGEGFGTLYGRDGSDSLIGGSFNDYLDGGAGIDTMRGGGGSDIYVISDVEELFYVFESFNEGSDTLTLSLNVAVDAVIDISGAMLSNFENVTITGGGNFELIGNNLDNSLAGGIGNDTLSGGLGFDFLDGGDGNDLIIGGGEQGSYTGGSGNDTIIGSALFESISAGIGDDFLDGHGGNDFLNGGYGNDTYFIYTPTELSFMSENGDDVDVLNIKFDVVSPFTINLSSLFEHVNLLGSGAINVTGNAAVNILTGNAGNNTLDGAAGADIIAGGLGNDTYVVDNSGDQVMESVNSGTDAVQSAVAYDLMQAWHVENLTLTGGSSVNGSGNWLDNLVTGNSAANVLDGNRGNDTLSGGAGGDTLLGGLGDDVLVWDAADGSVQGGAGTDTLRIDGGGITLDLTVIANTLITDVEVINLTGSGNNTLTLALSDVLAISSTTDILRLDGNSGDVVNAGAGWTGAGSQVIGARTYSVYTQGTGTLLAEADMTLLMV